MSAPGGKMEAAVVPLLVVSCDRYSDIWSPFFALFHRRWPDCPYPLYLGTNFKVFQDETVTTITVGEDVGWAESLLRMLDRLEGSEYVLLFLEDFFLLETVDTAAVADLVELARRERPGCLRLFSLLPPPHRLERVPGLGYFAPGDDYRVTLQVALWRVDTLKRLLVPGLNPWEFELLGNKLSEGLEERFWGVLQPVIRYEQVVEKGKWKPVGLEICREAGVETGRLSRPVFEPSELEAHYRVGEPGSPAGLLYAVKRAMLEAFRAGNRAGGLRHALRYLRRRPLSIQIVSAVLCGLCGPRALERLIRMHLRCQLARVGCRHLWARLRRRLRRGSQTVTEG
ncbi:hypothetical protein LLH00_17495 [bacterium]|nr:hypothetical protein [bacterium]